MTDSDTPRLSSYAASKPQNVEQIVKAATEYEYNAQVPIRYWLRTAAALLKESDIYMEEGDEETTYLLLFRHAHLFLAHLRAHPGAKDPSVKPLLERTRVEVDKNLKTLDVLKTRINQRYNRYASILKEREERRNVQSKASAEESIPEDHVRQAQKRKIQQLHGYENSDLAVKLAQQEFQRRAAARAEAPQPPTHHRDPGDDLSQRLQAIRSRFDFDIRPVDEVSTLNKRNDGAGTGYNYPSVKTQNTRQPPYNTSQPSARLPQVGTVTPLSPPSLPPKPSSVAGNSVPPPRPEKSRDSESLHDVTARNTTETTYTFTPTAHLENGNPLRTLFLPPTLRTTFLRLAYRNTKANLETCGFLAGTLISNALFVSKLIIPAQVSTSDTCEMTNESQLFDYVDSGADLMILGWIHTHPSQTCFMSSRDLHTHAGYQMMLPESVAIVCAPSKGDTSHGGDWGVYRLTDPPGKMAILNCTKPGIFHPHDVENVYTDALRPGHVVEAKGLGFEVVDLRDQR